MKTVQKEKKSMESEVDFGKVKKISKVEEFKEQQEIEFAKGTKLIYRPMKFLLATGLFLFILWIFTIFGLINEYSSDFLVLIEVSFWITFFYIAFSMIIGDILSILIAYWLTKKIFNKEGHIGKLKYYEEYYKPSFWVYNVIIWVANSLIWMFGFTALFASMIAGIFQQEVSTTTIFLAYFVQKLIISALAIKGVNVFFSV